MATPFDFTNNVIDAIAQTDQSVPASVSQRNYLRDLMLRKAKGLGRNLIEAEAQVDAWLPTLSKERASRQIDAVNAWLKDNPDRPRIAPPVTADLPRADVVPAGRYAIDTSDTARNEVAFYRVDRPTEGKWAGYVFVKQIVGGDEHRLSFTAAKGVLHRIALADAEACSARYGREIGECGLCGRQLTNDESRARGIGPICAAKAGW